jgi:threonine dehydratase
MTHRQATFIDAPRLAQFLGVQVLLASETFQYTGSFKFRAAFHLASTVKQKLVITASSGNFGQALAYACSLLGKSCIIVMPTTSVKVKVDAVRAFGGQVDFVDVQVKSRAERVAELAEQHREAYIASAYDDPLVIEGNSSLGREIAAFTPAFDTIITPVGGGGLISGVITGVEQSKAAIEVIGSEPLIGNDAARSLRAGELIRNDAEPQTIADGARPISLGKHNWEIIRSAKPKMIEVREETITEGVRLLFDKANLKVEPTGALSIAALMQAREELAGKRICCIASGGNVDALLYSRILAGEL